MDSSPQRYFRYAALIGLWTGLSGGDGCVVSSLLLLISLAALKSSVRHAVLVASQSWVRSVSTGDHPASSSRDASRCWGRVRLRRGSVEHLSHPWLVTESMSSSCGTAVDTPIHGIRSSVTPAWSKREVPWPAVVLLGGQSLLDPASQHSNYNPSCRTPAWAGWAAIQCDERGVVTRAACGNIPSHLSRSAGAGEHGAFLFAI